MIMRELVTEIIYSFLVTFLDTRFTYDYTHVSAVILN